MRVRVALYAVNGLGLGHLTRMMGLGRALRRLAPGAEILLLTSSEASHLAYREGFAVLKVPSRNAARAGGWRHDTFLRVAQSAVTGALASFAPHILAVDTFPTGSLGELSPVLRWNCRKVFVLRAQRPEKAADPATQEALRLFDLVLVPHWPGEDARPEEVLSPPSVPTVWTGPMTLRDESEVLPRAQARAALGLPPEGTCGLISLGGGGDPDIVAARSLLREALASPILAPDGSPVRWFECAGPLEPPAAPASEAGCAAVNQAGGEGGPVTVLRGIHPQMVFARAFDGALTAAGYNTTHEGQAVALPCVLWPFPRDVDDQESRARFLEAQGRALVFAPPAAADSTPLPWPPDTARHLRSCLARLFEPTVAAGLRAAMRSAPLSREASRIQQAPEDAEERLLEGIEASGLGASGDGTHRGAWAILKSCGWRGPHGQRG
jgi:UDP-N-acetylglucosamine--N-acetylmuramyl-(pentapeptide) pyrophosphoryl-undecaprenol N-acetylglucosamine transferase